MPAASPWLLPGSRAGRLTILVLIAATALSAVAVLVAGRLSALPDGAVLAVGNTVVDEDEFRGRVDLLAALYDLREPDEPAARDRFRRDVAQAVATGIVIGDQAAKAGVVVSERDVDAALDTMIRTRFPQGRLSFDDALRRLRLSQRSVIEEVRRQLTTARMLRAVTVAVPPVIDADVAAAYDQRRSTMVSPETRRLRDIVVEDEQQAGELLARLRGGADFATLATRSRDRETARTGGDLGVLAAFQLERPFADAAFAAPAGAVFGPVRTRSGWNVGQVVDIRPATPLPLDQVRGSLRAELDRERRLAIWRPWIVDRIRETPIRYADAYRPAHPGQPPV